MPCDGHGCENGGVGLHFDQIVDVVVGEVGDLDRGLRSSLADCALLGADKG